MVDVCTLAVDAAGLRALTRDLIRIESVTPPGHEGPVADRLAGHLTKLGLDVRRLGAAADRPNLIARLPGRRGSPVLLLNGHMDVLAPGHGWTVDPFGAVEDGDRIMGRGAIDMKGGLAVMAYVADTLVRNRIRLDGDLVINAVADEVGGSRYGTQYLVDRDALAADYAVVCEPTGQALYLAHRGALWLELTVTGKAAHGGRPWRGVNAIAKTARIIQAMETRLLPAWQTRTHPLLPPPTLNLGTIVGGEQVNLVADRCVATLDRRLLPGESADAVEAEVREFLRALRRQDAESWNFSLTRMMVREPYEIAADAPLVQHARAAYREVTGRDLRLTATAGFEDAGLLARAGMETIMFGPYYDRDEDDPSLSGSSAEYVRVPDLVTATRILTGLALRLLGGETTT